MKSEWYFKIMGQEFGPHSSAEMKHFAIMGRIAAGTMMRKGKDGKWIDAAKVQGLLDNRPAANEAARVIPPAVTVPTAQEPPTPLPAEVQSSRRRKLTVPLAVGISLLAVGLIVMKLLSPTGSPSLSNEQIVSRSEKAVAHIKGLFSRGTGFLVSDGLLVTNRHVLSNEFIETLRIEFPSASGAEKGPFKAKLVYDDPIHDLAFLSVDSALKPLPIADDFEFQKGQDVIVIGSPGVAADVSLENAVSKGVVSTETTIDGETYRQLGISINPGNSGGPVLDNSGNVVGVVTLKAKEQEGLAFCIPFKELRGSMAVAQQTSKANQELGQSNHRARAVFFVIAVAGGLYENCMGDYADGMQAAIARGRKADDGLAEVRAKRGNEFSHYDLSIIKGVVTAVVSDRNLPDSTRTKFADLWVNLLELQDYVNSPHGTYSSYRAKLDQLTDTRHRLIESLDLLVGK